MTIEKIIEGILFASGDPVPVSRLAALLDAEPADILDAAKRLADGYNFDDRGIRLVRLEDALQLVSAPELADYIRRALETRKPPKLSQAALEVLTVIAYYQPVTRGYVEQLRGVDSSYTVGLLAERGLIEPCGRLDVPGRPVLYRTTAAFLRSFGLSSLEALPKLEDAGPREEQLEIESAIEALRQQGVVDEA